MKRCPRCGMVKPDDQFSPDRNKSDGLLSRCRSCDAAKARASYESNKALKTAYYEANRDRIRQRNRATRNRAIEIYGGACSLCGSDEDLEFDHVGWDGTQHRKIENHNSMLRRIARLGIPIPDRELRLLCRPCHFARLKDRPPKTPR